MKLRYVLAVLLVAASLGLATAQTPAPKDPELIDTQGYQKLLQQYKGKPLLVTFWATWCEPCRDEYPMLNELAKQYAPQGLKVVGVSLDQDGDLILMRRFLARYKPVFPNYRKKKGEEDAFVQMVIPGWNGSIPASVFYGKDGQQVGHLVGAGDHDTYEAAIKTLLAK
ncbi:MAG TPA: TlpA disulfide reductase family protein [Candidatus Sulfotelmatobacter sp.]|jgi:thiol-disulfide isomerase/thioredoxin|nr:TlpA disulfide reductase family protein [Candidatus Sulfotelmatobacter sp.]